MLSPEIIYIQARLNKFSSFYLYICAFICMCVTVVIKEKKDHQSEQVRGSWEGLEKEGIRKTWREEKLKLEGTKRKITWKHN